MTLSDLSIKNPVFAWMLMIGLMVFGWIGFSRMGISQMPDVDFPVVTVTIAWENAAPEIMETQVADVVEDAMMSIEGITNVYSTSVLGRTTVTVEFKLSRSIDSAVEDVQSHLSQAQRLLPKDIDAPIIQKVNPEDQPIMWLALRAKPGSNTDLKDICRYISEHLKDELAMTPGVGNIFLGGFVDPALRVWLDSDKMAQREITVEDVLDAINTEHADVPAGYMDSGAKEYNVRVYGEAYTPEEFSNLVIPARRRGGTVYRTIRFSDIGTVEDGLNDVRRISRYQGERAVGMGIVKQRGTNAVAVGDAVKKRMKELERQLPKGMELKVVFNATDFTKAAVHELNGELVRSVILTSLVCLLFLGSWSATFNVLLAIPTSILGTFIALYFFGFTINSFTMLGLSLVIGIIVDDAIMVLENITRYREEGLSKVQAALVGAREITSAAMAASLAILAIFAPVVFMQGIVGKFFYQFGVTISVAVMISLLEALTIAPMRCSQFLEAGASNAVTRAVDRVMDALRGGYRAVLGLVLGRMEPSPAIRSTACAAAAAACSGIAVFLAVLVLKKPFHAPGSIVALLPAAFVGFLAAAFLSGLRGGQGRLSRLASTLLFDHSAHVVELALVLFVASCSLIAKLKKEFIPSQDQGIFLVNVTLPLGVSLDHTDAVFKTKLEPWMKDRPELDHYYCAIGGFEGGQVNTGLFFLTMKALDQRPAVNGKRVTQTDFMQTVRREFGDRKKYPDLDRVSILDMSQAGFSAQRGFPVQFMVQGPDWDKLAEVANAFRDKLKAGGFMQDVDTDYNPGMPELQIRPDRVKGAARGVTARAIGDTVNATIGGLKFGKFTGRGKRYDVRVRLVDKDRNSPKDLNRIWVRDNYGNVIRLPEVVSTEVKPSLFGITRYNRERSINIFGNPAAGKSQAEALDKVQEIGAQILPEGYHVVMSGNSQLMKETFESLVFVLVLGIFVAYMILATQYNSFIHPVTVLMALPFSVTGAFVALYLAGLSLNIYSMIGLILLMGIVKKNSILLVDFTTERRRQGLEVRPALLDACPVRLRPILMTSAATIAGAVPEALAKGPGSEVMVPMAVTVIGGVLVSTLLTLIVVPCFYELMSVFESHAHDRELKEALRELGELAEAEPARGAA